MEFLEIIQIYNRWYYKFLASNYQYCIGFWDFYDVMFFYNVICDNNQKVNVWRSGNWLGTNDL